MIIAFTLFIASFLGIVLLLALRLHKMNTGKAFVIFSFGVTIDKYLRRKIQETRTTLSFVNRRTMRLLFHFILDKMEEKFVKLKEVGHHKATKLIERAKAKEKSKVEMGKKGSEFLSKITPSKEE